MQWMFFHCFILRCKVVDRKGDLIYQRWLGIFQGTAGYKKIVLCDSCVLCFFFLTPQRLPSTTKLFYSFPFIFGFLWSPRRNRLLENSWWCVFYFYSIRKGEEAFLAGIRSVALWQQLGIAVPGKWSRWASTCLPQKRLSPSQLCPREQGPKFPNLLIL